MKNVLETTRNNLPVKVSPIIYLSDFNCQTNISYVANRIMSDLRYENTLKKWIGGHKNEKTNQ